MAKKKIEKSIEPKKGDVVEDPKGLLSENVTEEEIKEAEKMIDKEIEKQEVIPEKKQNKIKVERKLSIEEFCEETKEVRGEFNTLSSGFKTWWKIIEKNSGLERKSKVDWLIQFEKFKNREIK